METIGGFKIVKFRKLKKPIIAAAGQLPPHIYSGTILNMPIGTTKKLVSIKTTWDAEGRCFNWNLPQYFISIPPQPINKNKNNQ